MNGVHGCAMCVNDDPGFIVIYFFAAAGRVCEPIVLTYFKS